MKGNNTLKQVIISNEEITVKFQAKSKDEFHNILTSIKTIPGRRFFGNEKVWKFPKCDYAINILKICGFPIEKDIYKNAKKEKKSEIIKPITPSGLRQELWEFQKIGVGFVESRNGRAIIADEMRLGKTVQALGWLQLRPNKGPVLIICDASAKLVWANMIKDWLPKRGNKIQIIQGRGDNTIANNAKFIIVNYESLYQSCFCDICEGRKIVFGRRCRKCKGKGKLAKIREDISDLNFFAMIVDEAQKIRNITTYYTKIILELGKKINHVVATTGTPIENKPEEFYNIISLIDPSLFPTRWDFRKRYCGLYHDGYGWKYNGATNTAELHKILTDTIMIRRLRKEVEKDTPEKVRPLVPIEFDENCKSEYRITSKTLADMELGSSNILAEYEHLKQIAVQGKLKGVIKWIEEFLNEGDQKLIVFAIHKKVISILHSHFKNISVVLDGSTSSKINAQGSNERKEVEKKFQTDPIMRLLIGNLEAAGKAICLDAANDVAFIEFSFVPGKHLQAEDRPIHMRKKGGCIYAWYLIAKGTIEEDIFEVLNKKCKVLGQILDGKDTEEESIFGELLNKLKERERKCQ